MENHRFILEPYKGPGTRHHCPKCGGKGEFAKYIDTWNKYKFPADVGRCNRDTCGYHKNPSDFFKENPDQLSVADNGYTNPWNTHQRTEQPDKPFDYFDESIMRSTMKAYDNNSFVRALKQIFNDKQIQNILNRYHIGTKKNRACIFWQVDTIGRVRYGKVIHYLPDLHRDKTKYPYGIHKEKEVIKLTGKSEFNFNQCFFGEHLITTPENKNKAIAIVESEKAACICSEILPHYVWLSTSGKSGIKLKDKKTWSSLQGRKVVLFPDVDQQQQWEANAETFRSFGINVEVYKELAKIAPGTKQDVADQIIAELIQKKQQPTTPTKPEPEITETPKPQQPSKPKQPDRPVTASPPLNIIKGNTPAFIDSAGQIYIPTRKNSYHIYASAGHLNSPKVLPTVAPVHAVDISGMNKIYIKYF